MTTQASNPSNREAEMTAGSTWVPSPNGTKAGYYTVDSPSDQNGNNAAGDSNSAGTTNPQDSGSNPPPPTTSADSGDNGSTQADASGSGTSGSGTSGSGTGGNADAGNSGGGGGSALDLAGAGAPLQPIFDTVNGAVDDATGSSGLLHGVLDVAHTAGVGSIGATPSADGHSNLVTDALNLPGDVLAGDLNGGLSHITTDLNDTINAATGLVGNVLGNTGLPTDSLLGGSGNLIGDVVNLPGNALDGGIPHTVADLTDTVGGAIGIAGGLGGDGLLQPVTHLVDSIGGDLQNTPVASLGGEGMTGGILGGSIGDLGGSSSGNAAHAEIGPESDNGLGIGLLSSSDAGHTAGISALDVGSDGPQVADLSVLTGADGLNVPILNGLSLPDLAGTGSGGLLTVNGGNNDGNGGVIGGTVANLDGSSSGHLIDADGGSKGDGLGVGVLSAQSGADHTVSASAVDTGSHGPQLADLGVLTDADMINVPSLNGAGTDGLTGNLLGSITSAGNAEPAAPAPLAANLGEALDLLPGSITGDHGIVDVNGHHII